MGERKRRLAEINVKIYLRDRGQKLPADATCSLPPRSKDGSAKFPYSSLVKRPLGGWWAVRLKNVQKSRIFITTAENERVFD